MKNTYKHTKTTVSLLNYHFVFCPRYRRKIFTDQHLETFFKLKVKEICQQKEWDILAIETNIDHCHLFISVQPTYSPADVMKIIKGSTSHTVRDTFPKLSKMPSLWTRSYFVSTAGNVSSDTIQRYVEQQKTRSF